ncbi:MAG: hypothetical protein WCP46_04235 [Alphaproteobacteria bacterium]|jgi:hypothetical protein
MGKAKTASKNNPVERESAKVIIYNGQKVKPVKFISAKRKYMAVQLENGQMAFDQQGMPVAWSKIRN